MAKNSFVAEVTFSFDFFQISIYYKNIAFYSNYKTLKEKRFLENLQNTKLSLKTDDPPQKS